MNRFSGPAVVVAMVFGMTYALAAAGSTSGSPKAKSACSCVGCQCLDCSGGVCTCSDCQCTSCGCISAAASVAYPGLSTARGCCAVSSAKVTDNTQKSACTCENCSESGCACDTCDCAVCACGA